MRILHVLTAPRAEGTPRLVLDWLSVEGHQQEVLFLSSEGDLKVTFQNTEVWQFYNDEFKLRFKSSLRLINLVRRICDQRNPDLVIAWPFGLSHWITIGARLSGVKKILAHCGNPPGEGFQKKYFHTYLCFYLGLLFGNRVVACSNFVKEQYQKILYTGRNNLFVAHNALSIHKFLKPADLQDKTGNEVTMVGYLEEARDHRTLLEAWKIVEDKIPGIKLNIIGEGRLRNELRQLAEGLRVKNVFFAGRVTNVEEFLWRTRVYAFSTVREGFGTTLLEALAAGCQVVATDVPACREVLAEGKYGVLVPPRNPDKFSEAIINRWQTVIDNNEKNNQLKYVSQFTPTQMMTKYLNIAGID